MRKCGRRFSIFATCLLLAVSVSHAPTAAMSMMTVEPHRSKKYARYRSRILSELCLVACTFLLDGSAAKVTPGCAAVQLQIRHSRGVGRMSVFPNLGSLPAHA